MGGWGVGERPLFVHLFRDKGRVDAAITSTAVHVAETNERKAVVSRQRNCLQNASRRASLVHVHWITQHPHRPGESERKGRRYFNVN